MRLLFWFLLAVVLSMELGAGPYTPLPQGVHLCSIQPSVCWVGTQTSWLQYDHCLSHSAITQGLRCYLCKGFGGCSGQSDCPRNSTHCVIIATRSPISFTDLPLVTKMCYNTCPDVPSLGLGPHVSIACCQSNLCNRD